MASIVPGLRGESDLVEDPNLTETYELIPLTVVGWPSVVGWEFQAS